MTLLRGLTVVTNKGWLVTDPSGIAIVIFLDHQRLVRSALTNIHNALSQFKVISRQQQLTTVSGLCV